MAANKTYFHLGAFRGSVTNGTTNTAIAGVSDQALTRAASNAFIAPENATIRMGVAGGVNASRSRINTPAMRKIGLPYIAPLQTGITVLAPPNIADFGPFGPKPQATDEISVEATHTDAAPQIQWALMWLMFDRREPSVGPKHRQRFTSAITAVVGSWVAGAITFDQNLPNGRYEITGMDVFGTNLIAARLVFPGGGWRPGCLGRNAVASQNSLLFQDGTLGVYGEFDNVNTPQLEVYAEAGNTAQEGYLDLVRIGDR